VTEQMAANKFRVIYEQILLNTQLDVLNFWTERGYNIVMSENELIWYLMYIFVTVLLAVIFTILQGCGVI
jgi:hypothetical protein